MEGRRPSYGHSLKLQLPTEPSWWARTAQQNNTPHDAIYPSGKLMSGPPQVLLSSRFVGSTCFQSIARSKSHEHFCALLKYRTLPLGKFRLSATKRLAASVLPGVQGLQLASSLQDTYLSACHRPQSCAAKRLGPRHSAICSAVEQDRHFF